MTEEKKRPIDTAARWAAQSDSASTKLSSLMEKVRGRSIDEPAIARALRLVQSDSREISTAFEDFQRMASSIGRHGESYARIQKLFNESTETRKLMEFAAQRFSTSALNAELLESFNSLKAKEHESLRAIAKTYESTFRIPRLEETRQLLLRLELPVGSAAAYVRQHLGALAQQESLLASMRSPWLGEAGIERSATALLELQGIGAAVRSGNGFDVAATQALRSSLGDWRDPVSPSEIVVEEPLARTEIYVARGFNPSLTDFPEKTFQEGLALAGLHRDSQQVIVPPQAMQPVDEIEEAAFWRTNLCHNYLQRLERRIRQFIDDAMTARYGADWPAKRLQPQMLASWEEKKQKAHKAGMSLASLIEIADFTDYEVIICRKDHWREVFEPRFKRVESVRESFQRLYPIRVAAMHSRFVTKEDVLYVTAESTRLLAAISRSLP
ncbi:UNVERIFIED_ORG: hypothetical protein J2W38_007049 [Variovorax paradoxus]|nr:hypothetical protein [Variovorax paradoxus]